MSLLLHPQAKTNLERCAKKLPQALLLTGKAGVGLNTIAHSLANQLQLYAHLQPELLTKTSTVPQISVERVRQLYSLLRGKHASPVAVIIDNADAMTEGAQNAFLKLLEEPPAAVHFILTTHHPEVLLSTVKSRLQTLHIQPITNEQSVELIRSFTSLNTTQHSQLQFLASGLPAELHRLAGDAKYFAQRSEQIRLAKRLIEAPIYQRLQEAYRSKLTRDEAMAVIRQMMELLSLSPQPAGVQRIQKLLATLDNLEKGGNVR